MSFNGGKMEHIFALKDNLYTDEYVNPAAEAALRNGKYFYKIDGANHMLNKKADGTVRLYERYDAKDGICPANGVDLPTGMNASKYQSKQQCHTYYYMPTWTKTGKLSKIYDRLQVTAENKLADEPPGYYSVEVVGRKFQRTPGVDSDGALALHNEQAIGDRKFDNYQSIRTYLLEEICVEGLVIEHHARYWKVRSDCFDKRCSFVQLKKGGSTLPDNFITPTVISASV